jgi:hypothetical protein
MSNEKPSQLNLLLTHESKSGAQISFDCGGLPRDCRFALCEETPPRADAPRDECAHYRGWHCASLAARAASLEAASRAIAKEFKKLESPGGGEEAE